MTCGGLCPGLNDVIRAIVLSLHHHYGVDKVYGFRFGYEGLVRRHRARAARADAAKRSTGSTRSADRSSAPRAGRRTRRRWSRRWSDLEIGILFAIGGDGTLRGAQKIGEEAARRGLKIGVIGIPKTIDNDISFVQRTFGFETAVSEARRATYAANTEAEAARNGIGLVKLMGRDSGFIAAYSVLVDSQVNFCLVPEVPFTLERFLSALEQRLERRGHAVIVVAEGAGQDLMATSARSAMRRETSSTATSASSCATRSTDHFKRIGTEISLKYIDPSYTIRSVPATPHDSAFCLLLGHNAVHAGMSGRTNMVVSFWNHQFTHVPISLAVSERKKIDPEERSGAASSRRPVSRGTCGDRPQGLAIGGRSAVFVPSSSSDRSGRLPLPMRLATSTASFGPREPVASAARRAASIAGARVSHHWRASRCVQAAPVQPSSSSREHGPRVGRAVFRPLGQAGEDQPLEEGVDRASELLGGCQRLRVQVMPDDLDARLSGEHVLAGDEGVGHRPDRVHVAARAHVRSTAHALGRHVVRGADDVSHRRHGGIVLGAELLDEPEVEHLHDVVDASALAQHHVRRLHVAMDEPDPMRLGERRADLLDEVNDARLGLRPVVEDHAIERAAPAGTPSRSRRRRPACARSRRSRSCSGA